MCSKYAAETEHETLLTSFQEAIIDYNSRTIISCRGPVTELISSEPALPPCLVSATTLT